MYDSRIYARQKGQWVEVKMKKCKMSNIEFSTPNEECP
jgi:hypothetical protein